MTITISEDPEFAEEFEKAAIAMYEENNRKRIADGKLHIADITFCVRKQLIPQIFPSQAGLDIYTVGNFMRGSGAESSIVPVLEYHYRGQDNEFQMDIQFDNVTGHPDFINKTNGIVFEIKNTNAQESLKIDSDNLKSYNRQVIYYMLLTGMTEGKVIVQYGLPFNMEYNKENRHHKVTYRKHMNHSPYFFYKIHIPADEPIRDNIRYILNDVIRPVMQQAVRERDLTIIPIIPDKKLNGWKCTTCSFKKTCGMIPDKQTNETLRNLLLNVHIDNLINIEYGQDGPGDKKG